jgi:hypothetical protein
MALDSLSLSFVSIGLLAFGLWWFLRGNDEVPLAIAGFNFMFLRRLWVIEGGLADWARFDYGVSFSFNIYPHEAAAYMAMGALILTASYCAFVQREPHRIVDDDGILQAFLLQHWPKILLGFVLFTFVNAFVRPSFEDEYEDVFASSYSYQFTLAHSGFIILIAVLIAHARRGTVTQKTLLLGVIGATGVLTIAPSLRFAVLGWAIALAFVFTRQFRPLIKLLVLASAGIVVAFVFTISGLLRNPEFAEMDNTELLQEGVAALLVGSDVNMLDGFSMLMQVYPDHLDYGLGREHLEILLRPIPRAIWPEKPVGGWNQKLAVASGTELFSTGISPSLYGSFYGEGGILGVVLLSILYGYLFAAYVNWANRYGSALRWVLHGVFIASLFALMRGGDLPGIASFIGMSYWPVALFIWGYRRALRTRAVTVDVDSLVPGHSGATLPR